MWKWKTDIYKDRINLKCLKEVQNPKHLVQRTGQSSPESQTSVLQESKNRSYRAGGSTRSRSEERQPRPGRSRVNQSCFKLTPNPPLMGEVAGSALKVLKPQRAGSLDGHTIHMRYLWFYLYNFTLWILLSAHYTHNSPSPTSILPTFPFKEKPCLGRRKTKRSKLTWECHCTGTSQGQNTSNIPTSKYAIVCYPVSIAQSPGAREGIKVHRYWWGTLSLLASSLAMKTFSSDIDQLGLSNLLARALKC